MEGSESSEFIGEEESKGKKTVCAVTATAMLCLAQPVWGIIPFRAAESLYPKR